MTAPVHDKQAYTLREWAAMFSLSFATVQEWARVGIIPTIRIGRRRFITQETHEYILEHGLSTRLPTELQKRYRALILAGPRDNNGSR
jgi:hypothetical protein